MYIVYTNASNNTPSYTHINLHKNILKVDELKRSRDDNIVNLFKGDVIRTIMMAKLYWI